MSNGRGALSASVVAWVVYDLANTIFSVSILSFFFPLWLAEELGAGADTFNYITAASMLLVVLTAPLFGAIADLRQRRRPFLVLFTLVAVGCTFSLDLFGTVAAAIALFVAANFSYQSALLFYNSLLPGVAGWRNVGRVSGYGGAIGYVGTILSLILFTVLVTSPEAVKPLLGPFDFWIQTGEATNSNAFVPTAFFYLLFSLPAFLLIPDHRVRPPQPAGLRRSYRDVLATARSIRSYAGMGAFMLATFLYLDAANTVVSNLALYGSGVFDLGQGGVRNVLLLSTVFAAVGAAGFGSLVDRIGPRRTLISVLVWWIAALGLVTLSVELWMFYLAAPLLGVAFGATVVVSRVMLIALSPPEKLGEFFGFYTLAGRFSAVLGPLLTGLILTTFSGLGGAAYRIVVLTLALIVAAALLIILWKVPEGSPEEVITAFSDQTDDEKLTADS